MNLKFWKPKTCVCSNDGAKVYAIFGISKRTDILHFTNYCVIQIFLLWGVYLNKKSGDYSQLRNRLHKEILAPSEAPVERLKVGWKYYVIT